MFRNEKKTGAGVLILCLLTFFIACNLNLGTQPIGPTIQAVQPIDSLSTVPVDSITRNMRINVSPSRLRASKTDTASVLVIAYDDNHNPLTGKTIWFFTTAGTITAADTTNSLGKAHAVYKAAAVNTRAKVIATMVSGDSLMAVSQTITLEKLQVLVATGGANALVNTAVPVTISVLDGAGEPVSGAVIALSGALVVQGTTGGDGSFSTSAWSSTQQTDTVIASALGAADTATVSFWTSLPSAKTKAVSLSGK